MIAAAAAALAGCGSDGAPEGATPSDTLPASTFEGEATTIDGTTFDLADLAGDDLVVWFWAPW